MSRIFYLFLLIFNISAEYKILTTTNIIADLVNQIVTSDIKVDKLMEYGVDPHSYKMTTGDIRKINSADLVIFNGLHLEGRLIDIEDNLKSKNKILILSDGLSTRELRKVGDSYDPHYWMSIRHWMQSADYLTNELSKKIPVKTDIFKRNLDKYKAELLNLDTKIKNDFAKIKSKILITSHDAFYYYGKEYGLTVYGIQGISTVTEASILEIQKLSEIIKRNGIKSIFAESSVNDKNIKALTEGTNIELGGYLYADSLGEPQANTYLKMLEHNSKLIYEGLK